MHVEHVSPEHPGFAPLAIEARSESYRFVDRLETEWHSGANRFDAAGECLLGIATADGLIAIGGLNVDPFLQDGRAGRLRHLYVRIASRRQGAGGLLVATLVTAGRPYFARIRLRTDNPDAARLYARAGFIAVDSPDATHVADTARLQAAG